MEALGEAEADADLAHTAAHALGTEVDDDAERLEHVDRPALRRRRPTAVLGDPRARRRRSTMAAMVETLTVPAPSPPVPHVSTSGTSRSVRSTCSAKSSIVRTSAASSAAVSPLARSADRERGDLRVGGVARQDHRHRLFDEVVGEVVAPEQTPDHVGPQRCIHPPDATGGGTGQSPHLDGASVRRSCAAGAPAGVARARRDHPTHPASRGR